MSTELLNYCLSQLLDHPRALNIRVPLDSTARHSFIRFWSKARFEVQQQSIVTLLPDDPAFGRGYLWPYELHWSEAPEGYTLRIEYNLNIEVPPRELILFASVSESAVPFPASRTVFNAAKYRMLGKDGKRVTGTVIPALRPGVAVVQYSCQGGAPTVSAVRFPDMIDIESWS
jgi:hypothetical protein